MTQDTESTIRQADGDVDLMPLEMEALRLADLEGYHRNDAARELHLTPASFAQLIRATHQKIAEVLCRSGHLAVREQTPAQSELRTYCCEYCDRVWQLPRRAGLPSECPRCHGSAFHLV